MWNFLTTSTVKHQNYLPELHPSSLEVLKPDLGNRSDQLSAEGWTRDLQRFPQTSIIQWSTVGFVMLHLLSVTMILKPKICFCFVGCCGCFLAFFFLSLFLKSKQTGLLLYFPSASQSKHSEIYSSLLHLWHKETEWQNMGIVILYRGLDLYIFFSFKCSDT